MGIHIIQGLEGQNILGHIGRIDPGAIGAGRLWVDTSAGTGAYRIKLRNAADSGWEVIGIAFDPEISEATALKAELLADENIPEGYVNISLDEDNNQLVFRAKETGGALFTVNTGINTAPIQAAADTPLADEDIPPGYLNISLDEDSDAIVIKAKKSTGEVFTVTLSADA